MKPGVDDGAAGVDLRRRRGEVGPDLDDAAVVHAHVGPHAAGAGAVDDVAAADEEITGVGGHGKRMPLVAPAGYNAVGDGKSKATMS